jgi:hypothetical protein
MCNLSLPNNQFLAHISLLFLFFPQTHRIHLVLSPLLQFASMNLIWILKCTSKVGSLLMRVVKYI